LPTRTGVRDRSPDLTNETTERDAPVANMPVALTEDLGTPMALLTSPAKAILATASLRAGHVRRAECPSLDSQLLISTKLTSAPIALVGAFFFRRSVTDGDVALELANDHPPRSCVTGLVCCRRTRSPRGVAFQQLATWAGPSDGRLIAELCG
jgi:hypothetical protein